MDDIALLLQGAIRARGQVLLKLNVPDAKLRDVLAVLPSMGSPTIMALASGDVHAVESVVAKRGVNTLIPALKAGRRPRHPRAARSPRSSSDPRRHLRYAPGGPYEADGRR